MKILLIGGYGTIGRRVAEHFKKDHEVVLAGRYAGDFQVDISRQESIRQLFNEAGLFDAIVCMAGEARWAPFQDLTEQDFYLGIESKLMGQVNLVRIGRQHLNPGGSITLTTGILADHPVPMTSSAALVNGALHSFVRSIQLDVGTSFRVNVVSPALVEDAAQKYGDLFKGQPINTMQEVVKAYEKAVLGNETGKIFKIY